MSIPGSDEHVISEGHALDEDHVVSNENVVSLDDGHVIDLSEASRQLELAVHDAQVAYDCIALGNLDRAHTNAITARAAVDAAETALRIAVAGTDRPFVTEDQGAFDADEVFGAQDDEVFGAEAPEA